MRKTILSLCIVVALTVSASLSASPGAAPVVTPAAGNTFCTPPAVALVTPAQGSQEPVQLAWPYDCWEVYQVCLGGCQEPAPDPCRLGCQCEYCMCEQIVCINECGAG